MSLAEAAKAEHQAKMVSQNNESKKKTAEKISKIKMEAIKKFTHKIEKLEAMHKRYTEKVVTITELYRRRLRMK